MASPSPPPPVFFSAAFSEALHQQQLATSQTDPHLSSTAASLMGSAAIEQNATGRFCFWYYSKTVKANSNASAQFLGEEIPTHYAFLSITHTVLIIITFVAAVLSFRLPVLSPTRPSVRPIVRLS